MMWASAGATVVFIVVIIGLAMNRSSLAHRLGVKEEECDSLKKQIKALRDGLAARVAADPSLDDLAGLFDDADPST